MKRMINIIRTNSKNKCFVRLVKELDSYLKITDEDEHDFYNQFNSIEHLKEVVVIYLDGVAVGCAAIKKLDNNVVEVKRMFVLKENRGIGIAQKLLDELEAWAKELGHIKCVLETGTRQVRAIVFYKKCKYKVIPNYGQYIGMENSVCFEKNI
tara:strand:+ start:2668 stop:3126 length:459 start_codon:yes stop_codon:yes gene_type:complete